MVWYFSGGVLATDPPHTMVKSAKLQCMSGAFSHTQSLCQGFPKHILDHLYDSANISESFHGLMESIYRVTLDKFNIKLYIMISCSRRVAWSIMKFVYWTAHSKPSTISK